MQRDKHDRLLGTLERARAEALRLLAARHHGALGRLTERRLGEDRRRKQELRERLAAAKGNVSRAWKEHNRSLFGDPSQTPPVRRPSAEAAKAATTIESEREVVGRSCRQKGPASLGVTSTVGTGPAYTSPARSDNDGHKLDAENNRVDNKLSSKQLESGDDYDCMSNSDTARAGDGFRGGGEGDSVSGHEGGGDGGDRDGGGGGGASLVYGNSSDVVKISPAVPCSREKFVGDGDRGGIIEELFASGETICPRVLDNSTVTCRDDKTCLREQDTSIEEEQRLGNSDTGISSTAVNLRVQPSSSTANNVAVGLSTGICEPTQAAVVGDFPKFSVATCGGLAAIPEDSPSPSITPSAPSHTGNSNLVIPARGRRKDQSVPPSNIFVYPSPPPVSAIGDGGGSSEESSTTPNPTPMPMGNIGVLSEEEAQALAILGRGTPNDTHLLLSTSLFSKGNPLCNSRGAGGGSTSDIMQRAVDKLVSKIREEQDLTRERLGIDSLERDAGDGRY